MGKKKVKTPKVPDPIATADPMGAEAEENIIRTERRRGYTSSIITGALRPQTKKKSILG